MWFLILQMLLLLLIAAGLGAAFTYWWMSASFEDITEVHEQLLQTEQMRSARPSVTPGDLDTLRTKLGQQLEMIGARIDAIEPPHPPADLTPVRSQLAEATDALVSEIRGIERVDFGRSDLQAGQAEVGTRLDAIEQRLDALSVPPDLGPVLERLGQLEARLEGLRRSDDGADLDTVASGVAALSATITALRMPDLEPVHAQLRNVEERLAAVPSNEVDLAPLQAQIQQLSAHLREEKPAAVDLEPVHAHLRHLEERIAPAPDLEPLQARLGQLGEAITSVSRLDLAPIDAKLDQLEIALATMPEPRVDLGPVQERLTRIEEGMAVVGETDTMGAVAAHVSRIEEHLGVLGSSSVDLAPVVERLSQIEELLAHLRDSSVDLTPIQERLEHLDERIVGEPDFTPIVEQLEQRLVTPPVDLAPVQSQLEALTAQVGQTGAFDGLHARLIGLEGALQSLRAPRVDLDPLNARIDALQTEVKASLSLVPQPDLSEVIEQFDTLEGRLDLASIENRLTAIEYGLAGVHHQLRSRGDAGITRTSGVRVERRSTQTNGSRPGPRLDPIEALRRSTGSNLLTEAAFGVPDDLTKLEGVGDPLRDLLHDHGVFYFWQIAEWSPEEVTRLDEQLLDFKGRIDEHGLVEQARGLALQPTSAPRPRVDDRA